MKKTQTPRMTLAPSIAEVLKRRHYSREVVLSCARWLPREKTSTLRESPPPGTAKVLKRLHDPLDVILQSVRWYAACSLSLRYREDVLAERSMGVDHPTGHRCVIKLVLLLVNAFRKHKLGRRWRMDERVSRTPAKACSAVVKMGAASRRRIA
jgi:hypothetical protein